MTAFADGVQPSGGNPPSKITWFSAFRVAYGCPSLPKQGGKAMRIGGVSSEMKVSRDWLRRLERKGVVTPLRDRVGHRRYSEADIQRIRAALFPPKNA